MPPREVAPTVIYYIGRKLSVEYLEIPKAACTSIKYAILASDGKTFLGSDIDTDPHWKHDKPPAVNFRFTFVRHPVTRFISVYRNKIQRGYLARYPQMPQRTATPFETLTWIQSHLYSNYHPDKHFQLQTAIRKNRHRPQPADFIGCFEQLATQWAELQATWGLPDLPHYNSSQGEVVLDRPTLDLLYTIYRPDFQAFGYDLRGY
jgi:hypothetical protein